MSSPLARFAVALCLLVGSPLCRASPAGATPVSRGTVTLVLANRHAIVAVTDSRVTWVWPDGRHQPSPQPGQKLFRVDDRTVCTVAGFGGVEMPNFPEFVSTPAGILDQLAEQLRETRGPVPFEGKLKALAFLFEFYLQGVAMVRQNPGAAGTYRSELILAGYELDGAAKIAKLVLDTTVTPDGNFSTRASLVAEKIVGKELVFLAAGAGEGVVNKVLKNPGRFGLDKAIARYAASRSADRGAAMTAAELRALGAACALVASLAYPEVIGGEDQIGVLEGGNVRTIDQPRFSPREVNTLDFALISNLTMDPRVLPQHPLVKIPHYIYIDDTLRCAQNGIVSDLSDIWLDGKFFFRVNFENCNLHYDGGLLEFDPTNTVTNGRLDLGVHADRKSQRVHDLESKFPWARGVECCEGPSWPSPY